MKTAILMIGMLLIVANLMTVNSAFGQFSNLGSGTVYTNEDIANGKITKLNEIVQFEVTSASTEPTYQIGEMMAYNTSVTFESIEEGDVIVVDATDVIGKYVSHRVIDIDTSEDGSRVVTTQGDNNDISIEGVDTDITADRFIAKVVEK